MRQVAEVQVDPIAAIGRQLAAPHGLGDHQIQRAVERAVLHGGNLVLRRGALPRRGCGVEGVVGIASRSHRVDLGREDGRRIFGSVVPQRERLGGQDEPFVGCGPEAYPVAGLPPGRDAVVADGCLRRRPVGSAYANPDFPVAGLRALLLRAGCGQQRERSEKHR